MIRQRACTFGFAIACLASSATIVSVTPLSVRPARSSHPIRNVDPNVFLKNDREFCCPNFKKVLSLLYTPSRTAYGADLVEKSVGMVSANDRL